MVTVTFVLGSTSFPVHFPHLTPFLSSYLPSDTHLSPISVPEIQVLLPLWVTPLTLDSYISYLHTSNLHPHDVLDTLNFLDFSILIEDSSLETQLLQSQCLLNLARNQAIPTLHAAYRYKTRSELWKILYERSFNLIIEHLTYLIEKWKTKIEELPKKVQIKVYRKGIERSFKTGNTNEIAFKALKDALGLKSSPELLLLEEKRCLKKPPNAIFNVNFKEIETNSTHLLEIQIENLTFICNFQVENTNSNLNFSISAPNFEQNLHLTVKFRFFNLDFPEKIQLIEIFPGKSFQLSLEKLDFSPGFQFGIRPEFIFSSIISHISFNFDSPSTANFLPKLPEKFLISALKSKDLKINTEDSVLFAIGKWAEIRREEPKNALNFVNWREISVFCLLDSVRRFRFLRKNERFRDRFGRELKERCGIEGNKEESGLERLYKSLGSRKIESLMGIITEIARVVPGLDYTPRLPLEQEPERNPNLRLLRDKEVYLKELKHHYRLLQTFNSPFPVQSDSPLRIIPRLNTE